MTGRTALTRKSAFLTPKMAPPPKLVDENQQSNLEHEIMKNYNHPERLAFEFDMVNHRRSQSKFKPAQSSIGGMEEIKQGSRHNSLVSSTVTKEKL